MKWSNENDVYLLREVLVEEPFKYKPKSKERGAVWSKIAANMNSVNEGPVQFNVQQRSVRDRFRLLETKFKEKERYEEGASGISPEQTEIDVMVAEISEKSKEAEKLFDQQTE